MKYLMAGLACLFAVPAAAAPVSVAGGDWSNIPLARTAGSYTVSADVIEQIEAAALNDCQLPGQSKRQVKLSIPFIIHFTPAGEITQVVVQRQNCAAIEQAAGGAILTLAEKGEYRPTGENLEGWYRGQFNFISN